VATHGFALNVHNDLEPFSWIIPCGLAGVHMTSIARELAWDAPRLAADAAELLSRVRGRATTRFCELLGRQARLLSPLELGIRAPKAAPREPAIGASQRERYAIAHARRAMNPSSASVSS
jgi:lipoyl(octanoyl) transferase